MNKNIKKYIDTCRCCLKAIPNNTCFQLNQYFEDLFEEITGIKVNL